MGAKVTSGAERLLQFYRNWVAIDATGFGAMVLEAVGQETTGVGTPGTESRGHWSRFHRRELRLWKMLLWRWNGRC